MHKHLVAAGFALVLLLPVSGGEVVAGRNASGSLQWHSIREYAKLKETVSQKIYIHFWADWCGSCRQMEKETFANPAVAAMLRKNFFLIKVNTETDKRVADAFKVRGLPSNLFLSADGSEIVRWDGYMSPKPFMRVLDAIVNAH